MEFCPFLASELFTSGVVRGKRYGLTLKQVWRNPISLDSCKFCQSTAIGQFRQSHLCPSSETASSVLGRLAVLSEDYCRARSFQADATWSLHQDAPRLLLCLHVLRGCVRLQMLAFDNVLIRGSYPLYSASALAATTFAAAFPPFGVQSLSH